MPDTTCHMSISLDGFVAGPDQSREHPLGKRGREVHSWHLGDERANGADATAEGWLLRPRGAYVMGRNMFGPIRGEWDEDWDGWWGPEPPYHAPVFVLTHHAREPIEMEGGTIFHFVTQGFDAGYAQARETAGEDGIDIAGGASTGRQALAAGVSDELTFDVVPSCSAPVSGCSTGSSPSGSSRPRCSTLRSPRTSAVAGRSDDDAVDHSPEAGQTIGGEEFCASRTWSRVGRRRQPGLDCWTWAVVLRQPAIRSSTVWLPGWISTWCSRPA